MLAEHIRMLMERSKFSKRNFLETYAARGNQPGCGDHGRGVRSGCGGGGRVVSAGMLNGELDNRGVDNGDNDFAFHSFNNIDKCCYPDPEYQKMNPLEKRRLYFIHKKKKKSSDWYKRKALTSVNALSITMISQMYVHIHF